MTHPHHYDVEQAKALGDRLGVDWTSIDPEQFRKGVEVEFEHGSVDQETNITNDDPLLTGKVAWAHLKEIPDYYDRLEAMEAEGEAYWEAAQAG
jgi:hypothetical protein